MLLSVCKNEWRRIRSENVEPTHHGPVNMHNPRDIIACVNLHKLCCRCEIGWVACNVDAFLIVCGKVVGSESELRAVRHACMSLHMASMESESRQALVDVRSFCFMQHVSGRPWVCAFKRALGANGMLLEFADVFNGERDIVTVKNLPHSSGGCKTLR